jgi:hypothetical protein
VRYLPAGDANYNWAVSPLSDIALVMAEIAAKEGSGETVGLVLTFGNTATGGEWLFFPDGTVCFTPSLNRATIGGRTDVGWYISRILPAFETADAFDLESWRWEESV